MATLKVTSGDRLSLTLFLAAVLHGLAVLGVGFTVEWEAPRTRPPLIEITLARTPSDRSSDDYDYLAQANQDGGGEADSAQRPREASPAVLPDLPQQPAPASAAPRPAQASVGSEQQVITTRRPADARVHPSLQSTASEAAALELVDAPAQLASDLLIQKDPEDSSARHPSKRRIDARTRAHEAAAYMHEWVQRVERVGNLNYPEAARSRGLSGRTIVEAALRPDGTLRSLRVLTSSGHPVLDDAALRLVGLAAPFPPIPEAVLAGNDLLVITRSLEFVDRRGLTSR